MEGFVYKVTPRPFTRNRLIVSADAFAVLIGSVKGGSQIAGSGAERGDGRSDGLALSNVRTER
ncbi:hypothetical protein BJ965_004545 [Streptomyces luteogriseus]|uniref:Uncharacterized protein n=1 Tax=Streptomyces luteogriseus TaxID=68233 RepID=A0A7W7GJQ2_9ACTN|nr:hypothetical protein [Streptomyces luteogriseus]